MRRIVSFSLTFLMVFSMFSGLILISGTVSAVDAHLDSGGWEWHYADTNDASKAILTRVVRVDGSTEVNIPAHLSGTIDLLSIAASCFEDAEGAKITKILSMPSTVTSIGTSGFRSMVLMTSCVIGSGVTSIGELAFYSCTSLTSVTIPNSVTSIGDGAFAHSTSLTAINVDADNPNYASVSGVLYNKAGTTLIQCPGGTAGMFTIPNSVTSIRYAAFNTCNHLTSVTIPNSVTSIGNGAFYDCTALTSMTFLGLVAPTTIGDYWIANCPGAIRGHAYAASNFPTPGNAFYGLIMGTVIPVWTPTFAGPNEIGYEMTNGTTLTSEMYPIISELNATHDLYLIELDTWLNVSNVSINGGANWIYLSSTPWCPTVTSNPPYLNLTGALDSVTYRIYFGVPVNRTCQVHFAIWVSSTGEGVPFETFQIRYNVGVVYNTSAASNVMADTIELTYGLNYSVAVLDFFGNNITIQTFQATGEQNYVSIAVDVNSFKIFNQQDDFTKVRIYYANATTPISFFCAPNEPVETFLRDGNYSVGVTMYNNHTALTTEWFSPYVNQSEFILIQGNTISQVISDVAGVYSLQQVITTMVTPDVVMVAEDLPGVPSETIIFIHPWSVVAASVSVNGSGMNETLWLPHQNTTGSFYTVVSDDLYLSGAWATSIWINCTNGTSFYHAHNLPSYLALDGGNYTVVASANVTFDRHTEWREETLFFYTYYTTQKKYEVVLDLNNSMSFDWTNVNWLIGLPENAVIELSSVKVYDLDNALYLTAGKNYDLSATGVKMLFSSLNASGSRHMKLTMYDANASITTGATAYSDSYTRSTYLGQSYLKATASWTNGYGSVYQGEVKIKLGFDSDRQKYIIPSEVVVYDRVAGRALQAWEWSIADGLIFVNSASVPIGSVQSYDIYFHLDLTTQSGIDLNGPSFILGISWLVLLIFIVVVLGIVAYLKDSKLFGYATVLVGAGTFILYVFDMMGAI